MKTNAKYKMHEKDRIEKYILRKAFDTPENPYLPNEVLWRQKEQFSDGVKSSFLVLIFLTFFAIIKVGFSWIDTLKLEAEKRVTNEELEQAEKKFPINPPTTKEAYWYRTMFVGKFLFV
jgi:asparagine synthase (glutamine-hydrolysing)